MLELLKSLDFSAIGGTFLACGVIWYVFFRESNHKKFRRLELPTINDDNAFAQAGLTINYKASTITFPDGKTFPVNIVRCLRYEDFRRPNNDKWLAFIEIEDMENPVYTFKFSYGWVCTEFEVSPFFGGILGAQIIGLLCGSVAFDSIGVRLDPTRPNQVEAIWNGCEYGVQADTNCRRVSW